MFMKITPSSGNMFADLGFGVEEAEHLRVRSMLMIEVKKLIKERKLTQGEATQLMSVTQPRISDLVRGKIHLFRINAWSAGLALAGVHVEVFLLQICLGLKA